MTDRDYIFELVEEAAAKFGMCAERTFKNANNHIEGMRKEMTDRELRRNASGYYDPTAYEAIKKADNDMGFDEESERFHKLLHAIRDICALSDFSIEERIVLKDKRSGKVWR